MNEVTELVGALNQRGAPRCISIRSHLWLQTIEAVVLSLDVLTVFRDLVSNSPSI